MTGNLTREELCAPYFTSANQTDAMIVPGRYEANIVLYAIGLTYLVVSSARFAYYRKFYIRLKKRDLALQLTTTLGLFCQFTGGVLGSAIEYECVPMILCLVLVVPLTCLPIPIRLLDYYNRYIFAQALLDAANSRPQMLISEARPGSVIVDEDDDIARSQAISLAWKLLTRGGKVNAPTTGKAHKAKSPEQSVAIISTTVATPPAQTMDANSYDTSVQSVRQPSVHITSGPPSTAPKLNQQSIRLLQFLISTKMRMIILFVMLFPYLVVIIVDFSGHTHLNPANHCHRCRMSTVQGNMVSGVGGASIILGVGFAILVRKYPDPFGVVRECRYFLQYGAVIALIGFILDRNIDDNLMAFDMAWLVYLGAFMIQFITTDLQIMIAKRDSSEKAMQFRWRGAERGQASKFTSETVDPSGIPEQLRQTLEDPEKRSLFEKHLVSEFAVEGFTMYMAVEAFKKAYYDMNEGTRRARAKKIIQQHVDDNALVQVNLPFVLRKQLLSDINDASKPIDIDFFKEAQREIFGMFVGSFQRFIRSKQYQEQNKD